MYLLRKKIELSLAIKLANLKQQAFNRRFFVILDHRDKLIALCNNDVKNLKQKKYLPKNLSALDLIEKSFYYTPLSRNNDGKITPESRRRKKDLYMKYVRAKRKLSPKSGVI